MGRLTLRLPESLHRELTALARQEGISLNQYIVYALTRQITLTYGVQALSEEEVAQQRTLFAALLQSLGLGSFDEIEAVLAERESAETEAGLSPEMLALMRERLADTRASNG